MAGKINLNTASRDELRQVPGIGDECADILVDYRKKRGGIKSIDELDRIEGFGDEAIRHLKERGTV